MRTYDALLLAATVAAAAFATAQAVTQTPPPATTFPATCQAAHDADSRVSVTFCSTLLRGAFAPNNDTSFLADAAAAEGVGNANNAERAISAVLQRLDDGDQREADPVYRAVLVRCEESYGIIKDRFGDARQAIAGQNYGDVQELLSSVPSTGQSCDNEFPLFRRASPFLKYSQDNAQIALLTVAITSLIK